MDEKFIGGLINSVSRLIHLVACQTVKNSDLEGIRYIVNVLKLLKPLLDDALDAEIPSDEQLIRRLEELDVAVNKSREFMEKRSNKMSKIDSILQVEPMVMKVQQSSVEICHTLNKLLQSSPAASQLAKIEHCMQELQSIEYQTSEPIVHALKEQRERIIPSLSDIIKIMETLGLASSQELLIENIALEKERIKAELGKNTVRVDSINDILALVSHIHYYMSRFEQFGFINGVPVPSYFRCPLFLEIMQDPVIVASGQTYERSFIQKWLENGLSTCPKTHQTLSHTNLTPNFTVKALIANWYEDSNIKRNDYVQPESILNPFMSSISLEDFSPKSSFRGSIHRDSISRSSVEEYSVMNHQKMNIEKSTPQASFSGELQNSTHSCTESISSAITDISSKYDEKACLLEAPSMREINMAS